MDFEESFAECVKNGNIPGLKQLGIDKNMANEVFVCDTPVETRSEFRIPHLRRPTPLVYAICCECPKTAEYLIELGADVTTPVMGWHPIHYATLTEESSVLQRILHIAPEEVNATTEGQKSTPLHIAASGNQRLCSDLLEWGAQVNAQNANGETALHMACGNLGSEYKVTGLLSAGADLSLKDRNGMTPRDIALERRNKAALDAIEEFERKPVKHKVSQNLTAQAREFEHEVTQLAHPGSFTEALALLTQKVQALEERIGDLN